jgi:hypothetical protein
MAALHIHTHSCIDSLFLVVFVVVIIVIVGGFLIVIFVSVKYRARF